MPWLKSNLYNSRGKWHYYEPGTGSFSACGRFVWPGIISDKRQDNYIGFGRPVENCASCMKALEKKQKNDN